MSFLIARMVFKVWPAMVRSLSIEFDFEFKIEIEDCLWLLFVDYLAQ